MIDLLKRKQRYMNVFSGPDGEEVLKDLLKFCHYESPTFVVGDQYQTAHNEGMRRVALRIVSIINMDDETIRELQGD